MASQDLQPYPKSPLGFSSSLPTPATSPRLLSPRLSLPRPPRCLTPYPSQTHFARPLSSSPLSSPSFSPDELAMDPFRVLGPSSADRVTLNAASPDRTPRTAVPHINRSKILPMTLRMSSLSPTSPTDIGFLSPLAPPSRPLRIPLSPSVRKYVEAKKTRPSPITIAPPLSRRGSSDGRSAERTARAIDYRRSAGGSVPLPRTPRSADLSALSAMRTAMPVTTRRVGVERVKSAQFGPADVVGTVDEDEVDEVDLGAMLDDQVITPPLLQRMPSPGWAEFGVAC